MFYFLDFTGAKKRPPEGIIDSFLNKPTSK